MEMTSLADIKEQAVKEFANMLFKTGVVLFEGQKHVLRQTLDKVAEAANEEGLLDIERTAAYAMGLEAGKQAVVKEILEKLETEAFCPDRLSKCACTDEHELQNRIRAVLEPNE